MAGVEPTTSERVVEAVAEASECDVLELPPLYESIDPDALGALVDAMANGDISFTYANHRVTVDSDGTVSVDADVTERIEKLPADDD
jgi:hypothetical protein